MSEVSIDQAGIEDLFGPNGPVARFITGIVIDAETFASEECPVDTGRLRANIQHEAAKRVGSQLIASVGANVEYAIFVHEGYQPGGGGGGRGSVTRGKRRGKARFAGRKDGKARGARVEGRPFLVNGLRRALRDAT